MSLRLCTAKSARPSSSAASISFTKRPLPPTAERGAARKRSPSVDSSSRLTLRPGCAARSSCATWCACHSASGLLRVAILTAFIASRSSRPIRSGCGGCLPRGLRPALFPGLLQRGLLRLQQPEQLRRRAGQTVAVRLGVHCAQLGGGTVQQLVHDGAAHGLDALALPLAQALAHGGQGALHLGAGDLLGAAAQAREHRQPLAQAALAHEAGDLLGHQHAGLLRLDGARRGVLRHELLDVVHVVGRTPTPARPLPARCRAARRGPP